MLRRESRMRCGMVVRFCAALNVRLRLCVRVRACVCECVSWAHVYTLSLSGGIKSECKSFIGTVGL